MGYNLETNDIYTDNVYPNSRVNPKRKGAVWINNNTGEVFICTDNTTNNNVWTDTNVDLWKDLGSVTGTFTLNFKTYDSYNNFVVNLTGETRFTSVIVNGARERSGILKVTGGCWDKLKSFFSNVYYSFEFPYDLKPYGTGSSGDTYYFPYKITKYGDVIFTRC